MLFKCGICPAPGVSEEEHSLAFVEELWPYTPPAKDVLQSMYGCDMLYSTKPTPAYYVVIINSLLGTAAIMKHPCTPTIPHDGLVPANRTRGVQNKNPNARADASPGDGTGSALFRLNAWCMQWGQKYAVTRPETPLPFTGSPTVDSWFPHSINLALSEHQPVLSSSQHSIPRRVSPCEHSNWNQKNHVDKWFCGI